MDIDILSVLDKMDAFRRKHENDKPATPDYCMRCLEAILAGAAGYKSRTDWTDALKENPESEYSKGLLNYGIVFHG